MAMTLMSENKAVVIPILLSACSWREENFAKLEMLPRKADPVSSFTPRTNAWFLVEEGLKKVAEVQRARVRSWGRIRTGMVR